MENLSEIKNKLLNSEGLRSLVIESTVFNLLKELDWQTHHSPYFVDPNTKKLRELDVKARKYFTKDEYACDVDLLIECKNLNNYHIIANNKSSPESFFDAIWLGNYVFNGYNKLDELLLRHEFTTEEIAHVKEKLLEYCNPDQSSRWYDYHVLPFEIPTFNTYRETNINSTKDIDNSVIWKCILSLQSAIGAHEELLMQNIDFMVIEDVNQQLSKMKKIEILIEDLKNIGNHIYYIHPIIVVDAKLWEYTSEQDLQELKYFRLNIQKLFEGEFWVDIVNFKHLKEYLKKSNRYIDFHKKKGFKIH